MFRPPHVPEHTYKTYNIEGIPMTDSEGMELPKSRVKKLTKEWEAQGKLHAEWLVWVKENGE